MKQPPIPGNETQRLRALKATGLLDTHPEERFDRLTRLASRTLDLPIALVSLVDEQRQWFKSAVGLTAPETGRDISFCGHAIHSDDIMVVPDARLDPRFAGNPLLSGDRPVIFYAGAPLRSPDGYRLGTLCVIDHAPRAFGARERRILRDLADCVEQEILTREDRLNQQNAAFRILNDLAMSNDADELALINRALRRGGDFLRLPIAMVSEVTGSVYTVRWCQSNLAEHPAPGTRFDLGDTYCALLLENRAPLAISDMGQSRYRERRCYKVFRLEAYIAAPIHVEGKLFGTLSFSGPEARNKDFTDTEITFVTLLARWIANAIERRMTTTTLAKLADQAPGVLYQYRLWPDGSSTFPYASPSIEDLYGKTPEALALDANSVFDRIHPDDLGRISESIELSARDLTVWHQQYRVVSGRQWCWVEGRATPERLPDNSTIWHGYITDIHDRKRMELALEESEEQFRRLFEKSPIGIVLAKLRSGEILDMNDAFLQSGGYQREELRNQHAIRYLQDGPGTAEEHILQPLRHTGRFGPIERDIPCGDGSVYPANIQGIRINPTFGEPLVWILVEDISERKKVDRMKNEFISTVSHELRTPLTSLAGSLGLIASGAMGPIPEQQQSLIEIAARNSEQLKLLINDLLDMEKLVAGRLDMEIIDQVLSPLVQDALEQLETYAVEREVSLRLSDHSGGALAPVDARRFRQALNNLLSNAIKFSPQGSQVDVEIAEISDGLRVSVSDQGPGIPEHFRARLFEKFAQADSSDTRGRGGTGLGLAITRAIMEGMGGNVGFESEEGRGSVFWLTLPKHQEA
jgi:PAS domain S-box-containing protein